MQFKEVLTYCIEVNHIRKQKSLAWFPLDRNGIVKSCDSSRFWNIVEKLATIESKNITEISSDLQPKNIFVRNSY